MHKDQPPASDDKVTSDYYSCPPILEVAAGHSTMATFELLRSKGAPLDRRPLHLAVSRAIKPRSSEYPVTVQPSTSDISSIAGDGEGESEKQQQQVPDKDRAETYAERMAMVRHLVDTLGLDVNAPDQPAGMMLGNHYGTPLCYVAVGSSNGDCKEVTQFLLDRSADPGLVASSGHYAIGLAESYGHLQFLEAVEEWKARQAGPNLQ